MSVRRTGKVKRRAGAQQRPSSGSSVRERAAAFRAAEQSRERRRRRLVSSGSVVAVAVIAGIVVAVASSGPGAKGHAPTSSASDAASATLTGPPGPEGIPLEEGTVLAPASSPAGGRTVDGIRCEPSEQVAYHIHSHLTVYVNGALRPIPAGIGIVQPIAQQTPNGPFYSASLCYYWLHVHAQDGVIHVEAPSETTYTLGQFFAIWRQPLLSDRVGPARGTVTVFVNGARYSGDPARIPLTSHEDIQLDVGSRVAPKKVDWLRSQL
ncbi:MAG: hypothetical protein QOH75_2500 [Actinomycetota bacterium]|nr:hypothetical protein [Actinomycetota bacterium]